MQLINKTAVKKKDESHSSKISGTIFLRLKFLKELRLLWDIVENVINMGCYRSNVKVDRMEIDIKIISGLF